MDVNHVSSLLYCCVNAPAAELLAGTYLLAIFAGACLAVCEIICFDRFILVTVYVIVMMFSVDGVSRAG